MRRAAKALVKAGEIIHKLWIILSRDISEQMLYRGGGGGVQSRIALCSSILYKHRNGQIKNKNLS